MHVFYGGCTIVGAWVPDAVCMQFGNPTSAPTLQQLYSDVPSMSIASTIPCFHDARYVQRENLLGKHTPNIMSKIYNSPSLIRSSTPSLRSLMEVGEVGRAADYVT